MKICKTCDLELEDCCFYKHHSTKDGLNTSCKNCTKSRAKKWHNDNRESSLSKKRVYSKRWREDNPAKHAARQGEYRAKRSGATPLVADRFRS